MGEAPKGEGGGKLPEIGRGRGLDDLLNPCEEPVRARRQTERNEMEVGRSENFPKVILIDSESSYAKHEKRKKRVERVWLGGLMGLEIDLVGVIARSEGPRTWNERGG